MDRSNIIKRVAAKIEEKNFEKIKNEFFSECNKAPFHHTKDINFVHDLAEEYAKGDKKLMDKLMNLVGWKDASSKRAITEAEPVEDKPKKLTKDEALEILYKFIKREDTVKPNFTKSIKVKREDIQELRKIYDSSVIKKLYSYGFERFGFEIEGLRVDVDPAYLEVNKIK